MSGWQMSCARGEGFCTPPSKRIDLPEVVLPDPPTRSSDCLVEGLGVGARIARMISGRPLRSTRADHGYEVGERRSRPIERFPAPVSFVPLFRGELHLSLFLQASVLAAACANKTGPVKWGFVSPSGAATASVNFLHLGYNGILCQEPVPGSRVSLCPSVACWSLGRSVGWLDWTGLMCNVYTYMHRISDTGNSTLSHYRF